MATAMEMIPLPAYALNDDLLSQVAKYMQQLVDDLRRENLSLSAEAEALRSCIREIRRRGGSVDQYRDPPPAPAGDKESGR